MPQIKTFNFVVWGLPHTITLTLDLDVLWLKIRGISPELSLPAADQAIEALWEAYRLPTHLSPEQWYVSSSYNSLGDPPDSSLDGVELEDLTSRAPSEVLELSLVLEAHLCQLLEV